MDINWDDLHGQDSVKILLTKLIDSSNIPHAFLFQGIDGVGKDFTAFKFAENLNAKFLDEKTFLNIRNQISNLSEPFIKYIVPLPRGKNEIDSSGPIEKLSEEDIQIIHEEFKKKIINPYYKISIPKANNIKVSSIRDIKKFISVNFSDVKFRVIIISDAHFMNEEAQNALLKNLEEPPDGIIFILTTPFPEYLRETIRSRCWNIHFNPLSNVELKEVLISRFDIDGDLSTEIAPFANGSVLNALKLLDNDFEELLDRTISFLRYSFGHKYNSAYDEISSYLYESDPESIRLLIQMIITWLNDLQKFKIGSDDIYFSKYKETLLKFNSRFPSVNLGNLVFKLDRLSSIISNNINLNVIAINLILNVASLAS